MEVSIKIGVLVSRSGPAGLWGPSCEACAMLAAAEMNTAGGIYGEAVELIITDAGETCIAAIGAVDWLIGMEHVDGIVGMHPGNVRDAIKARNARRVPYIYTPQYEGGECSPGVAAIGGTDAEMLAPTLPWFVENHRARRFFVVGNDYVWPHVACRTAHEVLRLTGARMVGGATVPFGSGNYGLVLEAIRRAHPDVVLMFFAGAEAARFNRAFAGDGLSAGILRF